MHDLFSMLAQYSSSSGGEEAAAGLVALFFSLWAGMGLVMIVIYFVMILLVLAIFIFRIYLKWKIMEKAGLSPWLALLAIIPIGELVAEIILAYTEWPNAKQVIGKK